MIEYVIKLQNYIIIQFLIFVMVAVPAFAQFSGGDGLPENPWQIATPEHLDDIRNHLDGHFIQVGDIDLSEIQNWEPIGEWAWNPFTGSYDGNGYKIKNLAINRPDDGDIGLFGYTSSATFENVSEWWSASLLSPLN